MDKFICGNVFNSLSYARRHGISGPYGNFMFNFLKTYYFFLIHHCPRLCHMGFGDIEKVGEYALYSGNYMSS